MYDVLQIADEVKQSLKACGAASQKREVIH
jgi:hypothetical protein